MQNCAFCGSSSLLRRFCDVNRFKVSEMDSDLLWLAVPEKEQEESIRLENKTEWEQKRSKGCSNSFTADARGNDFPRVCCDKNKT